MKRRSVTSRLVYGSVFADSEVALVKALVREFCGRGRTFQNDEFDDLVQECLMHWNGVCHTYRPDGLASKRGYMRVVIRNQLNTLTEARTAAKRKTLDEAVSLDVPAWESEDAPTLADTVESRRGPTPREQDLAIDISVVLESLTQRQTQICQMKIEGSTILQNGESLGMHRSSVYDEIRRIREIFTNADLEEYLK